MLITYPYNGSYYLSFPHRQFSPTQPADSVLSAPYRRLCVHPLDLRLTAHTVSQAPHDIPLPFAPRNSSILQANNNMHTSVLTGQRTCESFCRQRLSQCKRASQRVGPVAQGTFGHAPTYSKQRQLKKGTFLPSFDLSRHPGKKLLSNRSRNGALKVQMVFTGIVQGMATVKSVERKTDFISMHVDFPEGGTSMVTVGASVALNGTCLTVTSIEGNVLSFDVIVETLRRTNLGELKEGSKVNFERAARLGDEIGGHNVSGHVHCTATVHEVEQMENNTRLTFQVPDEWMKYILPKGYIAIDGTSLTIGEVWDNYFTVYLIPETLRVTLFGNRIVGNVVNIEVETQTQAIVDTVERVVARHLEKLNIKVA